jgi:two-component system, NtrC family, sensor kinase
VAYSWGPGARPPVTVAMKLTPNTLIQLRPQRGLNLAVRLYGVLLIIFIPAFSVYYVYLHRTVQFLQEREIDRNLITIMVYRLDDFLINNMRENLLDISHEDLRQFLNRIVEEPSGVEAVTLFRADELGNLLVLAESGRQTFPVAGAQELDALISERPVKVELSDTLGTYLVYTAPLRLRNQVSGVVRLLIRPDAVWRWGPEFLNILIVSAVSLMLTVGVGILVFFTVAVRRPVRSLLDAMHRVPRGEMAPLATLGAGEFGWLGAAYNQMTLGLKATMDENQRLLKQVKGYNEELRMRVEAATGELAAKNTQLQTLNEKLFQIQRQMTTLEKLATFGYLATTIAHELGTPLNAISGHLQLLLMEAEIAPAVLDRLTIVNSQVDRMADIVRSVLRTMRVPAPHMAPTDVNGVILGVVELISPIADKQRIRVRTELGRDLPWIPADANQLSQVFMNLFTNAVDAMADGGTLTVRTALEAPAPDAPPGAGILRVEVSDSGHGMNEEIRRRVFEPFNTTKGADADRVSGVGLGVGLGLSICRQIVQNHRGDISLQSEPGHGTTFFLRFPLVYEWSAP